MIFNIVIRHKSIEVWREKVTLSTFSDREFEVSHRRQPYRIEVGFGARAMNVSLKRLTGQPLERTWNGPLRPGQGKYRLAATPATADYHWTCWVTLVDNGRPVLP